MTPTGRPTTSSPEMQNLPGTPAAWLEMAFARHGVPEQTADAPTPREFVPSVHQTRFFSWVRDGRGSAVLVAVA